MCTQLAVSLGFVRIMAAACGIEVRRAKYSVVVVLGWAVGVRRRGELRVNWIVQNQSARDGKNLSVRAAWSKERHKGLGGQQCMVVVAARDQ